MAAQIDYRSRARHTTWRELVALVLDAEGIPARPLAKIYRKPSEAFAAPEEELLLPDVQVEGLPLHVRVTTGMPVSSWMRALDSTNTEADLTGSKIGIVVAHRREHPAAEGIALLTLRDLAKLIALVRG
jgi:hypothetical protein